MQHIYDPDFQNKDLAAKTTAALDKLADAFKTLQWASQKENGFSPLQQKLVFFIAYHGPTENTVSQLVKEFQVTKATISDCIKTLEQRKLLTKVLNHKDNRRFHITLTEKGKEVVAQLNEPATPVYNALETESSEDLKQLYTSLFSILSKLKKENTVALSRSCHDCKAYRSDGINHAFCMELRTQLHPENRRIDCPKHQPK
ncbi:MarR family winged helix-turn-helix transcriptional regulator [Leeuwenhoekiella palythoae]|uniref:HTH-type transcriptional regulator SarZ n=1 Tax=Leeuwenhoekiella palythoae TaxID=573501 RepID=A0A1M5VGZ2_9FLAO|nr:MarR family transcriptional regulator [Leeuwenhoekiella palythoae]RXG30907.1 transcriptional regulator [Leeuwenhoekiella palythoae]SHH74354.1 transcriptional regulator [Leeuwenhoekiella palythoae]